MNTVCTVKHSVFLRMPGIVTSKGEMMSTVSYVASMLTAEDSKNNVVEINIATPLFASGAFSAQINSF